MWTRAEFWGGVFWLAIGIGVTIAGYGLGLGAVHAPGSGFAVFWIGVLMTGLATAVLAGAVTQPGPSLASLWQDADWPRVVFVIVLLLTYGFLFEPLGFLICTFILLACLMLFVDPVGWVKALVIAAVATVVAWEAVTKLLKIQLPAGVLDGWLF